MKSLCSMSDGLAPQESNSEKEMHVKELAKQLVEDVNIIATLIPHSPLYHNCRFKGKSSFSQTLLNFINF